MCNAFGEQEFCSLFQTPTAEGGNGEADSRLQIVVQMTYSAGGGEKTRLKRAINTELTAITQHFMNVNHLSWIML